MILVSTRIETHPWLGLCTIRLLREYGDKASYSGKGSIHVGWVNTKVNYRQW
jgi:hypothetical protein